MPRVCSICNHHDRLGVERALLGGESYRNIAVRFDTSTSALQRHRADHIPASLVQSQAAKEIGRADTLLDDVRSGGDRAERLYQHAESILERAMESKDLKTALAAISGAVNVMREGRAYLELRGEITGELNPPAAPASLIGVERLLVLTMPKTESASAIERERLAKFGLPRFAEPVQARRLGAASGVPSKEEEYQD